MAPCELTAPMELEVTSTPRETLVWAPTTQDAAQLRRELTDTGFLVIDADPWELDTLGRIPEGEHHEFDPSRIFNVEIGADANASLQALVDGGHTLIWHRWQTYLARKVWGVSVKIPPRGRRRSSASTSESAVHFGIPIRATRGLSLRMTRDTYARINRRSSLPRWHREMDPDLWDSVGYRYEDAEHRVYTDAWCEEMQIQALANYDLNMAHFASLNHAAFDAALQRAVKSQRRMVEVTDLTKWDGVAGLYIMVLDESRQAYVGATDASVGIQKRIKQHWTGTKSLDRLIWGNPQTSIISIDSFRALDTTRIFSLKTTRSFAGENPLLEKFPPEYMLNRVPGGRDVAKLADILGVDALMKRRDFAAQPTDSQT
ncbi:hypothetical protein E0W80_09540 [Microbacterium sp. PI-1]|uniref:hypothetical protein n=1 Tax=unclassified Microbacterium TaxID=2609290 RepID=UPI00103C478B|nr:MULTISPECIES: hypothetical protein [unclassified Microbacterium]TCJ23791.1 hypothetical protein E0W80_09540 [Microbacterium sp. PI-1]UUE20068.1 hypothetical protein LRQ07_14915 [Microbacterium sp. J1-1]